MKKKRDFKTYLDDIYESIEKGISFAKDMTYEEFDKLKLLEKIQLAERQIKDGKYLSNKQVDDRLKAKYSK